MAIGTREMVNFIPLDVNKSNIYGKKLEYPLFILLTTIVRLQLKLYYFILM